MKASTAYAISKTYTNETAEQFGAVKGASCQVGNITFDADGNTLVDLIWKNDAGVTQTSQAIIQRGLQGEQGDKGDKGDKFVYDDFTPEELALLKGAKGDKGDKGVGIDTITKTSTSGIVDIYTIVYDDGTETQYSVVNGANITKISELENDENFVKATTLSLVNYYLKDESYSKAQIDELLRNVGAGLSVKIVATLPLTDISPTTIYLINTSGSNYNQYMYIDGEWANLGSTEVDMSSYYNKSQIDLKLEDYVTANRLTNKLDDYVLKTSLGKVAKSNSYNDLDDLPEIPDVSGIKPYTDSVQDSSNTAPTSKALYDAVETINGKFDDYAKAEDLDDYVTKAQGVENKGKALVVGEDGNVTVGEATTKVIDDSVVTETSTWSSKKINDSLVDLEGKRGTIPMDATSITGDILQFALDNAETWAEKIYATGAGVTNVPSFSTVSDWSYSKCIITKRTSQIWVELLGWSTGTRAINVYDNNKWSGWQELATMDKVAKIEQLTSTEKAKWSDLSSSHQTLVKYLQKDDGTQGIGVYVDGTLYTIIPFAKISM